MRRWILNALPFAVIAVVFVVNACATGADPVTARAMVQDEGAVLLDVRSTSEFAERHLDGAVHLPVGEIEGRLDEVAALTEGRKDHPIVVYCRSGMRAATARDLLKEAGYSRVVNLGGIDDWTE